LEEIKNHNTRQYVVFRLAKEEYGVDTRNVTIIERMTTITRVPKTPPFILGVINLRGDIIPVMDLRARFNLPAVEYTDDTRIVIIKVEDTSMGMVVDSVAEVIQLSEDAIENVTNFSNDLSMDFILGVGKADDRIITLLNLEKLIRISDNN